MNPKDKKNFNAIKRIVKNLDNQVEYDSQSLRKAFEDSGLEIINMGSVENRLVKIRYITRCGDGNYKIN